MVQNLPPRLSAALLSLDDQLSAIQQTCEAVNRRDFDAPKRTMRTSGDTPKRPVPNVSGHDAYRLQQEMGELNEQGKQKGPARKPPFLTGIDVPPTELVSPQPDNKSVPGDQITSEYASRDNGRASGGLLANFVQLCLQFVSRNQVVLYVVLPLALVGMAVLLTTIYGGRRSTSSTSSSTVDGRRRRSDGSFPVLDKQPLLTVSSSVSEDDCPNHGDNEEAEHGMLGGRAIGDHHGGPLLPASCARPACDRRSRLCPGDQCALRVFLRAAQGLLPLPVAVFPKRLLDLCNQETPLTFSAFLPIGSQDRSKWLAHGRHSELFQVVAPFKRNVLKVMPIVAGDFSKGRLETITAAIECYLKLSPLLYGMRYRAPNFIEVQRISCVFDWFPEWLLGRHRRPRGSSEPLAESLASEISGKGPTPCAEDPLIDNWFFPGTNQCCLTRHFAVFELCYAGKPLSRIMLRSAVQGRSLVQQASCCLAVAERAVGLRILSVDSDKLLVLATDTTTLEYRVPGRPPLTVDCAGLKAHVAGCVSFAFRSDEAPDGKDDDNSSYYDSAFGSPSSNCSGLSGAGDAPQFYGNVMWLGAVMDNVVHKLRSEVSGPRARDERSIFAELLGWQRRLQQCNSAADFVAAMGL
ncbi:uncharacterized protein LOC144177841 [Haemaphysalis longicornis]